MIVQFLVKNRRWLWFNLHRLLLNLHIFIPLLVFSFHSHLLLTIHNGLLSCIEHICQWWWFGILWFHFRNRLLTNSFAHSSLRLSWFLRIARITGLRCCHLMLRRNSLIRYIKMILECWIISLVHLIVIIVKKNSKFCIK